MSHQKMHRDELDIDLAVVRRLIAGQFPTWSDLLLSPVASIGTDNALFRLGSNMLVRLPRIDWATASVEKEHIWLPRIAPLLPVPIPVPLAKGQPTEEYPWAWSVYSWLDGVCPSEVSADLGDLANDLGEFVAALGAVDLPEGPSSGRGGPLASRNTATRAAISALHAEVDGVRVTAIWEESLAAPIWHGPPVWVHGDLLPGNVLVCGRRLCGVIDFAGLGIGDPACDMLPAWSLFSGNDRRMFRVATGADDATWSRGRGWALSIALIILPYYRDTNPGLSRIASTIVGEVLDDAAT